MGRALKLSLVGGCCFLGLSLAQAQTGQKYVPGEIIVKLKKETSSEKAYSFLGKAHSAKKMNLKRSWGKMKMHHFSLKGSQSVDQALAELRNDPNVEYAEPNYIVDKASQTGIQETYDAPYIHSIEASEGVAAFGVDASVQGAWQASSTYAASSTTKPIIAVIDTGLDLNHSVFTDSSAIWINSDETPGNGVDDDGNGYIDDVNGWNFVDKSGTIYDDDGHGTHVAGIIMSVDQNIYSSTMSESKIQIMPLKFLNGSGSGTTSDAIQAIYYAVNNGADVLNNSWGGHSYSAALHEAVAYAYSAGVSFVAAAGNSGSNNDFKPMYPASYDVPNVLAVAATHDSWTLTSFSNYGEHSVDLGARGYFINSTIPGGGYGDSSGTSMASPYVAGTAIQMKVVSPNMLGYQIKQIIDAKGVKIGALSGMLFTGGRLHAEDSIIYAASATVLTEQPDYETSYAGNRELASSIAGGGCGMVTKLYNDYKSGKNGGPGNPTLPGPQTWYVLLIIGILILPLAIASYLRSVAPENRRRYDRFVINSDVRLKVGDRELVGSVSSISMGGVQVNTDALIENGGIVTMSIASPEGNEQIQVQGRVVWSEQKKAYGVAFQDTPISVLDRIADWTKGLKKAS